MKFSHKISSYYFNTIAYNLDSYAIVSNIETKIRRIFVFNPHLVFIVQYL